IEKALSAVVVSSTVSLNRPTKSDGPNDTTLEDFIGDSQASEAYQQSETQLAASEAIEAIRDILTEREFNVLAERAGLIDGDSKTLDEIGALYGLTKERIRQIE